MPYTMRTRAPSKLSIVQYPTDDIDHNTHEEDSRDEESAHDSELSSVESMDSDAIREEHNTYEEDSRDEESIDDNPELSDVDSIDSDAIREEQERLHASMEALVRSPIIRYLGDYAIHQAPYSMSPPSRPRRSTIESIGTVGSGMTNYDYTDKPHRVGGFPGMRHIDLPVESEAGEYAPYDTSDWFEVHRPTAEEWRGYGISMLAEFRATGKLLDPKPPKPKPEPETATPPASPVVSTSQSLVKLMATGGSDAEEIQRLIEKTKKVEKVERRKVHTPKWERKWKVKEAKARARALKIAAANATGSSTSKSLIKFVEPPEVGFIFDPKLKTQLELAKASKCRDYAALKVYEEKLYGWPDPIIKIKKVVEVVEEPEELMSEFKESDDEEEYQFAAPAPSPEVEVKRDFLGVRKGFKKVGHAVKDFFSRATSALHRPWARKGTEGTRKENVVGAKRQALKRFFSGAAPTPTNDDGPKMGDALKKIFSPATFSTTKFGKFEVKVDVELKGKEEGVKVASEAVDAYFSAGAARAPSASSPYGTDNIDSRKASTTSFKGSLLARLRGRTESRKFAQGKIPSGSYTFSPDFDVRNFPSASIVYNPNPSFISTPATVNADTFGSSETVHRIPPAQTTSTDDTVKTPTLGSTTPINTTAPAETTASDADMEAIACFAARKLAKLARLRAARRRNHAKKKAQEERRMGDEEKRKAEEQMQAKKLAEQEKCKVNDERRKAGDKMHKAEEERVKNMSAAERLEAEYEKRKADKQGLKVEEERREADKEKQAKITQVEERRKAEREQQRCAEAERRKANEEKTKAVAALAKRPKAQPEHLRKAQPEDQRYTEADGDLLNVLETATRKANEQKSRADEEKQAKVAVELEEKRKAEEERLATLIAKETLKKLVAKAKLKAAEQKRKAEEEKRKAEMERQRGIEADRILNELLKTNKVEEIAPWETEGSVAARLVSNPPPAMHSRQSPVPLNVWIPEGLTGEKTAEKTAEDDWEDIEDEQNTDTAATPQKQNNQAKPASSSVDNQTTNDPRTQTSERTPRQPDFTETPGNNTTQTFEPTSSAMSSNDSSMSGDTTTHTNTDGFLVWADGRRLTVAEILQVTDKTMAKSKAGNDEIDKYLEAKRNGTLGGRTFGDFVNRPLPANDGADGTPTNVSADRTHTSGAHHLPPLPGMPSTPVPSNPMAARHEEIRKRNAERDAEWARIQKQIEEVQEMAAKALESKGEIEQCEAGRAIDEAYEELRVWREEREGGKASAAAAAGKGKGVEVEQFPRAESSRAVRVRMEEQRRPEIDEMIKKAREEWEARKAKASSSAAAGGQGKGKEVEFEEDATGASTSAPCHTNLFLG